MKKFQVVLAERHRDPIRYTISATNETEAYKWGERNAESLGIAPRIEVSPHEEQEE